MLHSPTAAPPPVLPLVPSPVPPPPALKIAGPLLRAAVPPPVPSSAPPPLSERDRPEPDRPEPDCAPASDPEPAPPPLGAVIAAAIAAEGGTMAEALGSSRKRAPTRSRQAAMWLAFKLTPHSLQTIGAAVGRHHTTVLYGIRAYERRRAEDAAARARGDRLLSRFATEDTEKHDTQGARS